VIVADNKSVYKTARFGRFSFPRVDFVELGHV